MTSAISPSVDVIKTVVHPLVRSMYLKKDLEAGHAGENILVIETNFTQQDVTADDTYLVDLLIDLQDLKDKAEKEIGTINRVDIRRH